MLLYLALDQGGHASRAIVYGADGGAVAQVEIPVATFQPHADWVEHDPEEMVSSVRAAALQVLTELGAAARRIVAAGLATQRSSVVCWDNITGQALSPVLSWQDRRTASDMAQYQPAASLVRARTGLPLSPHYGASKLRWCWDHLPAVRAAAAQEQLAWGPLASFLAFRLLRERPLYADPANASRTLLWNINAGDWDDEQLALFNLPRAPLPVCVSTRHAYGHLDMLDGAIPLRIVTGDQSAALFGNGPLTSQSVYVNMGTGAFLQFPTPARPQEATSLLTSVAYREGTHTLYVLEGTVNGAGSALREAGTALGLSDEAVTAALPCWLNTATTPPLFLNGVGGLGSPYWAPDFPSSFIGEGDAPARMVAVVESIAFLIQANVDALRAAGQAPGGMIASGGLSRLDGLCQRLADLSGTPVHRPESCEATARGLAYLLTDPALFPVPTPCLGGEVGVPRGDIHLAWSAKDGGTRFTPQPAPALYARYRTWRAALNQQVDASRSP